MPKRLTLCFDGIWNLHENPHSKKHDVALSRQLSPHRSTTSAEAATNVRRLFDSISERSLDGRLQLKWYDAGQDVPWFRRRRSDAFGLELDQTIQRGYAYVAALYEPGDELFLYGFSRGAYIARCLVDWLTCMGLPPAGQCNPQHLTLVRNIALQSTSTTAAQDLSNRLATMLADPSNHILIEAYHHYRTRPADFQGAGITAPRLRPIPNRSIRILGVWETVGPFGIPTSALAHLNGHRYHLHGTEVSPLVGQAYHALAIDEHRPDHNAALWTTPPQPGQTVEQRWFAGAHGDVGGSYPLRDLADCSLAWMQRRSLTGGLAIDADSIPTHPNALAQAHDSFSESLGTVRKWFHSRFYRPVLQTGTNTEMLDDSVHTRLLQSPRYRPINEGLQSFVRPR